jgi:hypothetical protein
MILPVLIGATWNEGTKLTWPAFRDVCEGEGLEPEFIFVEESDSRTQGVATLPTIRIFDDSDPFGEPLIEHVGVADGAQIIDLIMKGLERV